MCGSDGVTYHGSCNLARAECKTGKKIEIVSLGECPKPGVPKDRNIGYVIQELIEPLLKSA